MSGTRETREQHYQRLSDSAKKLFDLLYGPGYEKFLQQNSPIGEKWEPLIFAFDSNLHLPSNLRKLQQRYQLIIPEIEGNPSDQEVTFWGLYNSIRLEQN